MARTRASMCLVYLLAGSARTASAALDHQPPDAIGHREREIPHIVLEEIAQQAWPHVDEDAVRHERAPVGHRLGAHQTPPVLAVLASPRIHPQTHPPPHPPAARPALL